MDPWKEIRDHGRLPLASRFRLRVNIPDHAEGTCWTWGGMIDQEGYGRISLRSSEFIPGLRKDRLTHRLSWEITFGEIPNEMCVLHRCDNRKCVRPSHLFLGDRDANNKDRENKGRGGHSKLAGAMSPNSKMSIEQISIIRSHPRFRGWTRKLAKDFGVHHKTILKAANGKTYKDKENG